MIDKQYAKYSKKQNNFDKLQSLNDKNKMIN